MVEGEEFRRIFVSFIIHMYTHTHTHTHTKLDHGIGWLVSLFVFMQGNDTAKMMIPTGGVDSSHGGSSSSGGGSGGGGGVVVVVVKRIVVVVS